MDNPHIYTIVIKSDQPKIDAEWNEWQLETTHFLQLGDIINLSFEKGLHELFKDYNTTLFKVISREFLMDSENTSSGGVLYLYISPVKDTTKEITDNPILKQNIDMQDLSTRLINILHIENIRLVEDLTKFPIHKIKKFNNLGKKSFDELLDFMKKKNLSFNGR